MPKSAFTLVELLVVVAIIVVLLALLAPALDKAVDSAEMATCAARAKAVMHGVTLYAGNFKRTYPYRPQVEAGSAPLGSLNAGGTNTASDDRPALRGYVPINYLNCPRAPKVDLVGSKPTTAVFSQYNLWFGFHYKGMAGMRRIGDRLRAREFTTALERDYNLLISDISQLRFLTRDYGMSSHMDDKRLWVPDASQDKPAAWNPSINITLGWYGGTKARGTLDLNYGYQDGEVRRVDKIAYEPADDDRIDYIPNYANTATDPERAIQVPGS
jgi:prepilin-type N-terminal cleavage/methylation domain-containing protein